MKECMENMSNIRLILLYRISTHHRSSISKMIILNSLLHTERKIRITHQKTNDKATQLQKTKTEIKTLQE